MEMKNLVSLVLIALIVGLTLWIIFGGWKDIMSIFKNLP